MDGERSRARGANTSKHRQQKPFYIIISERDANDLNERGVVDNDGMT